MKILFLTGILLFGFTVSSAQTLEDNLKNLSNELNTAANISLTETISQNFAPVDFSGCSITYRTRNNILQGSEGIELILPLNLLDKSKLTLSESAAYKKVWSLDFYTLEGSKAIKWRDADRDETKELSVYNILLKDEKAAKKILKDFSILIELCKTK